MANDPEDFDRGKHEKDLFKELILQGNVGQLYDGGWFDVWLTPWQLCDVDK